MSIPAPEPGLVISYAKLHRSRRVAVPGSSLRAAGEATQVPNAALDCRVALLLARTTRRVGLIAGWYYAYLWDYEAQRGREEGRKDRPCVIALAVQRQHDGETLVTVLPVTHRPPDDASAAVEIPRAVKKHLGLDHDRSWVLVAEGDQFVWPGYDLRKVVRSDRYEYGFLPPRFFNTILAAFRLWHKTRKVTLTPR